MAETSEKLAALRRLLSSEQLDGILFAGRANFAWLTGGGDSHIVSQDEVGFGALLVTPTEAFLYADAIEAPRIQAEEPVADFALRSFPWTDGLVGSLRRACEGKRIAADLPLFQGLAPLPTPFTALRAPLNEAELRRYRALGRECSAVVEAVAHGLQPGETEHETEAALAGLALGLGIQPHVVLVAFDDRIRRFRHPPPTAKKLRKQAMLVLCGKRHGLIASMTRLVHFGPLPRDLARRHESVCRVEAALWAATRPGVPYGEVLRRGIAQYAAEGFADEWRLHHQGGPTGYSGRDFLATPDESRPVIDGQAVAWNPSITGTKSEDTFVVRGERREVVTACSSDWPTLDVEVDGCHLTRPAILVR